MSLTDILGNKDTLKTVSVRLMPKIISNIDEYAEKTGCSRQQVLVSIIEAGLSKVMDDLPAEEGGAPPLRPTFLGDFNVYNPDRFIR